MPSKTLTLRILDEKLIDSIEFIKECGDHKTDTKAIISAIETFEEDHYRILKLRDELDLLKHKVSQYESYFELIADAETFKKSLYELPKLKSLSDIVSELNP
jgi:hypothetical protein